MIGRCILATHSRNRRMPSFVPTTPALIPYGLPLSSGPNNVSPSRGSSTVCSWRNKSGGSLKGNKSSTIPHPPLLYCLLPFPPFLPLPHPLSFLVTLFS